MSDERNSSALKTALAAGALLAIAALPALADAPVPNKGDTSWMLI